MFALPRQGDAPMRHLPECASEETALRLSLLAAGLRFARRMSAVTDSCEAAMGKGDLAERMWAEALATLERAERLQRQFFLPAQAASGRSCWAPPTDVFESANEFVVLIALPGISADRIEVDFDAQILTIKGERRFTAALACTTIRRL
jgi:HSP20 family molecular chaperone IbpA